jgi:hypothetical protein
MTSLILRGISFSFVEWMKLFAPEMGELLEMPSHCQKQSHTPHLRSNNFMLTQDQHISCQGMPVVGKKVYHPDFYSGLR